MAITDEQVKAAYKAYSKAIFIPEYITKQTYKDAMRAALEAAEAAAWRPIEEAPKDGTDIFVWKKLDGIRQVFWHGGYNKWLLSENDDIALYYTPTHFRHLPEPPK